MLLREKTLLIWIQSPPSFKQNVLCSSFQRALTELPCVLHTKDPEKRDGRRSVPHAVGVRVSLLSAKLPLQMQYKWILNVSALQGAALIQVAKKIRSRSSFERSCWRRLLRVPWTARKSNQSILKEISPEYSLEGLMLKLKLQYFGHLMQRTDSLEKTDVGKE